MPTSYTSLIGLALPVTGELSGTWGDTVNNYITNYLDSAVAGTQTISGSQTAVTLSVTNGSSLVTAGSGSTGSAQFQIINCTGNPAGLLTITAPASSRQYIIINATSTSQSVKIVGTGPTTGVTLISGEKAHVAWNGSDFVKIATTAAAGGSNTQVQYNSSGVLAGSSNLTFDGTNLTVGGTASATKLIPTGGAITGNGMYLPAANSVAITTNGAQAIYIDSSQNVGVGVTPSAWYVGSGTSKAIQFNASSALYDFSASGNRQTQLLNNAYLNTSANFIYLNTDAASRYMQNAGIHSWYTAGSGTAGNTISFTQAMTLDASGNLGLGVTPSAWSGYGSAIMQLPNNGTIVSNSTNAYFGANWYYASAALKYISTAAASYYAQGAGQHSWFTAPSGTAGNTISFTQAMTLDASGRLLVKATSNTGTNTKLAVGAGLTSGNAVAYISTEDVNVDGVQISNWTGSATTNRVSLGFDSSGVGGFRIGMPGGVNAFQIYDSVAATERARITSGGYFKASDNGTYNNSTGSFHELYQNSASEPAVVITTPNASYTGNSTFIEVARNTTNNSFYALSYYNTGAAAFKFRVADSGNVTNTNGSYGTISDVKMKVDIVDAGSQWADIKAIRFRKFKMKSDPKQVVQLGVVAQELEQTSPGLVEEHADRDGEGNDLGTTTKSVKTSVLLMKAAVALQEAMARIEKLEAEVAALKGA